MEPHLITETELNKEEAANALGELIDILTEKAEQVDEQAGTEAAEATTDNQTADAPAANQKAKSRKRIQAPNGHLRKFLAGIAAVALVMSGVAFGVYKVMTLYPYAVTANDDVICYVSDKYTASEAIQKAAADLAKEDSDVILVTTGPELKVERADTMDVAKEDILTVDDAAETIVNTATESSSDDVNITVASTKVETSKFTPEPNYVEDNTALAGTTVIENEGKDGTKEITKSYVTVNGKVEKEEDLNVEVLDEGEPAVIVKGTLGVPDGEDWRTYEGQPVYNDGDDLAVTATGYAGKLRYVLGGHNIATGVDCVGFVREMYRLYGINLSSHLRSEGIGVSYSNAQPGDILCFSHHYGIYLGNGKMVHAANPKADVCVSGVGAGGKLIGVRRIIP